MHFFLNAGMFVKVTIVFLDKGNSLLDIYMLILKVCRIKPVKS